MLLSRQSETSQWPLSLLWLNMRIQKLNDLSAGLECNIETSAAICLSHLVWGQIVLECRLQRPVAFSFLRKETKIFGSAS
jgi:hypothetical protein